jgi:hypothetical protein
MGKSACGIVYWLKVACGAFSRGLEPASFGGGQFSTAL